MKIILNNILYSYPFIKHYQKLFITKVYKGIMNSFNILSWSETTKQFNVCVILKLSNIIKKEDITTYMQSILNHCFYIEVKKNSKLYKETDNQPRKLIDLDINTLNQILIDELQEYMKLQQQYIISNQPLSFQKERVFERASERCGVIYNLLQIHMFIQTHDINKFVQVLKEIKGDKPYDKILETGITTEEFNEMSKKSLL